ncbi:VanZ family protein [Acidaminococcus massiliensis]|uniref:VanZ family protein n=1 Tax=Acidaminococcus massiliensis TaxID=1852375 RepID=UPI0035204195
MGRRVLWMLLVLLLGFIWGHSLQNGTASQAESQSVLHLALARWGNLPGMGCLNFYTIRKLAHLTEFAALGMVLSGLAGLYGKRNLFSVLFWGACVGTVDEGIQLFSPGRSAQVSDVLLDTCGVLAGALVLRLVCRLVWGERTKERSRR